MIAAKPKLFLLHPNFKDLKLANDIIYFCPDCAYIEGILSYYPGLRYKLEIIYVDYEKPRTEIIDLLGENNQSCPCLLVDIKAADIQYMAEFQQHSGYLFSNETKIIAKYFAENFNAGFEHP